MLRWTTCALPSPLVAHAGRARLAQSALVARGDYLVNTIMTCANCHTPQGPRGRSTAGKRLLGRTATSMNRPSTSTAPTSRPTRTPASATGATPRSRRRSSTGMRPNGVPLARDHADRLLPDPDRRRRSTRVVAYLKSLPPVKNKVPDPVYKIALHAPRLPGRREGLYAGRSERQGEAAASISSPSAIAWSAIRRVQRGGLDVANSLGKGGREFPAPGACRWRATSPRSRTKGIGAWTDAEIKTAITQGKRSDGTPLKRADGLSSLRQDDRRRSRRHRRLSADRAGRRNRAAIPGRRRGIGRGRGRGLAPF